MRPLWIRMQESFSILKVIKDAVKDHLREDSENTAHFLYAFTHLHRGSGDGKSFSGEFVQTLKEMPSENASLEILSREIWQEDRKLILVELKGPHGQTKKILSPCSDEIDKEGRDLPQGSKVGKPIKILLVEDDAIVEELWKKQFPDISIVMLSTPEELLATIKEDKNSLDTFSLIVLDYHFENSTLTGFDCAKQIKKYFSVPVFISSGLPESFFDRSVVDGWWDKMPPSPEKLNSILEALP